VAAKIWFTSDTHFGHVNIIEYCRRPFPDVDAMDAEMIRRWNDVVAKDDTVYHLGDFAMGDKKRWAAYLAALNGRKLICVGNHDLDAASMVESVGFDDAFDDRIIEVEGRRIWLNHFPIENPEESRGFERPKAPGEFDVALCGHVHNRWIERAGCINVGVDVWDFIPVGLDELPFTGPGRGT